MRPPFQPSREGPRKPEGGPEAPQECFHKELRSALENRGVAGATGGGNEESCSIRSKKKKKGQTELEASPPPTHVRSVTSA